MSGDPQRAYETLELPYRDVREQIVRFRRDPMSGQPVGNGARQRQDTTRVRRMNDLKHSHIDYATFR